MNLVKQQETVRGEQKSPTVDKVESRKAGERKVQAPPRQLQNKLALDVAKHLHMGNSTAQQGRQFVINVQRKDITTLCAKQANWHNWKHSLRKSNF